MLQVRLVNQPSIGLLSSARLPLRTARLIMHLI